MRAQGHIAEQCDSGTRLPIWEPIDTRNLVPRQPEGGLTVGWRWISISKPFYGGQIHLPCMRGTSIAKAPARWDGQALARRLRLVPGDNSAE